MAESSTFREEQEKIEEFLEKLKEILKINGENSVFIEKREINKAFELEEGLKRKHYLEVLCKLDYIHYEKTLNDTQTGKLLVWREFYPRYRLLNGGEIYLHIKVRILSRQNGAICLSFHPASRKPKLAKIILEDCK